MVIADFGRQAPSKGMIELGFGLFMRVLAIVALIAGLIYWARLTGLSGDPAQRFDLLAVMARSLSATMALLLPTAALGLWLGTRWGIVIWVLAAAAEITAYGLLPGWFGARPEVVMVNAVCLVAVTALTVAVLAERRVARLRAR